MNMKNNNYVVMIVVAIIIAAVAFFGGMQYQKMQTATGNVAQNAQGNFQGGQNGGAGNGQRRFGGRGFGGATIGQIVSVDNGSITVKLQDGSSKIVNISNSTKVMKMDTASTADLKTGETVAAIGTTNSDGSVTAQSIQLNPQFRGPGGAGGQNGQPSPSQ